MINIIISVDPSTDFLYAIIKTLELNSVNFILSEIYPDENSYNEVYHKISKLERSSTIIFLGHGQDNQLYGGESPDFFPKKPFVKLNEMNIFKDQHLFLLACNSSSLIKSSFRIASIKKSIGFGGLPTSKEEVDNNKKLSELGISIQTIDKFKDAIVNIVSTALLLFFQKGNNDFIFLTDYLTLLIDKRINKAILVEKDRNLGDLLFKMKNEISIY